MTEVGRLSKALHFNDLLSQELVTLLGQHVRYLCHCIVTAFIPTWMERGVITRGFKGVRNCDSESGWECDSESGWECDSESWWECDSESGSVTVRVGGSVTVRVGWSVMVRVGGSVTVSLSDCEQ